MSAAARRAFPALLLAACLHRPSLVSNPACSPGEAAACAGLGQSWAGGDATCRDDGSAWDVSRCVAAPPAGGRALVVKPALRDPRWSTARCNDGTPFWFMLRMAKTPSPIWNIHLGGGGWCDDDSGDCASRDPTVKSTTASNDGDVVDFFSGGIFSQDPAKNDLADANMVLAWYCSSDSWTGATVERRPTRGDPVSGWYFSGHANVRALVGILEERYGLDDADPRTRVLFGGGSAGARGAVHNRALVASMLPRTAAAGRLALLVDAGWTFAWDDPRYRLGDATTPDAEVWRRARAFWGATFESDCEQGELAAGRDPAGCFLAPTWYPYVARSGPVFVQQCSLDAAILPQHHLMPTDADAPLYQKALLGALAPATWLFSGASPPYHTISYLDAPLGTEPPGKTFPEVFRSFWRGEPAQRVVF